MKYGDEPGIGWGLLIDAEPEAVWAIVSDPATPAAFSDEFQGAEWENAPDGPALGATFRGYNKHPELGWEWDVECVITRFEQGRLFGWRVEPNMEGGGAAEWWFTIEPVRGRCRLWFQSTMGPGFSGLSPAIEAQPDREDDIVANRLDAWSANMAATVEGIKALAEAR